MARELLRSREELFSVLNPKPEAEVMEEWPQVVSCMPSCWSFTPSSGCGGVEGE